MPVCRERRQTLITDQSLDTKRLALIFGCRRAGVPVGDTAGVPPSHLVPDGASDGLPTPTAVCRSATRGQPAQFQLSGQVSWSQILAAADRLRAELPDDLLVIVSPGSGSARSPSLKALRLIDEADGLRLRDQLQALVAEFREISNRLALQFRLHVEPAYEQGDWYPDQLVEDGETWSLHIHGEHCLFTSLKSGAEIEVHTDCPDAIDPGFLLGYAESADRYPRIRTACLEGFHDMCRLLELAAIPLIPMGS